ncbi:MAG TPA: hypothetical protein VJM83_02765, partial [Nitrospirota bacterium]|nr:hypothetical protein [Nitrospirota bacterium]
CGDAGVREEDLDDILGLVGRQAVKEAASAVLAQDPAGAFSLVDSLVDKGQDLRRFSAELLGFFRDLLVCRISKAPERALDLPAAEAAEYKEMAANLAPEEIIRVMNLLTRLTEEMKWSANPRISLELALVKAASRPIASVEEIIAGIKGAKDILPRGRAGQAPGRVQETPPPPARQATDSAPARKAEHKGDEAYYSYSAAGKTDDGDPAADLWDRVREEIKKQSKAPLAAKMKAAAPKKVEGGVLTVVEGLIPFKPEEVELIAQAADGLGGVKVKILQQSGGKEKTLADHKKERETTKREKIKEEAVKDPIVRSALDLFGGEIVDVESEKTGS